MLFSFIILPCYIISIKNSKSNTENTLHILKSCQGRWPVLSCRYDCGKFCSCWYLMIKRFVTANINSVDVLSPHDLSHLELDSRYVTFNTFPNVLSCGLGRELVGDSGSGVERPEKVEDIALVILENEPELEV